MSKVNGLAEEQDVNAEFIASPAELYSIALKSADAWIQGKPVTEVAKLELKEVVEQSF